MTTDTLRKLYLDRSEALVRYYSACTTDNKEKKEEILKELRELDAQFNKILLDIGDKVNV